MNSSNAVTADTHVHARCHASWGCVGDQHLQDSYQYGIDSVQETWNTPLSLQIQLHLWNSGVAFNDGRRPSTVDLYQRAPSRLCVRHLQPDLPLRLPVELALACQLAAMAVTARPGCVERLYVVHRRTPFISHHLDVSLICPDSHTGQFLTCEYRNCQ